LAGVASDMCASQAKYFSKECDKKRVVCDVMAYRLAIYLH
jgi:hypothetical protein